MAVMEPVGQSRQADGCRHRPWAYAALLLLAVCAYMQFVSASAGDKNWLLIAARMWVSGKSLYTGIIEINPPLIIWLYSVPAWLALHLPVTDYHVLALLGFAVGAGILSLCLRLIAHHPAFQGNRNRQWAFGLLLAFVFLFFTAPMYFFDREHILLLFTFPYMLRFMPGLSGQSQPLRRRLPVGALAAIGFCIKPHAAVVFIMLQLLYVLQQRSLRILLSTENIIVYISAALYGAGIYWGLPEYWRTVLPMALATYSAYSRKINGIYSAVLFIVMIAIPFADFRPRHATPMRRDVYYFLGVCLGYLIYAALNNGWAYTYNPLLSMARFMAGWMLLEYLWLKHDHAARALPVRQFAFGARACAFVLLCNLAFYLALLVAFFLPSDCEHSPSCLSSRAFFTQVRQYQFHSFGMMSLEFSKGSELSRLASARWETRFNHLWMLPKFVLSDARFAERNRWITEYVADAYAQDLTRNKPDLVFVDASPELFRKHAGMDLPAYFGAVASFKEAWGHYAKVGVIEACKPATPGDPKSEPVRSDCRFDVFRRTGEP